jgi:hypothetical protein
VSHQCVAATRRPKGGLHRTSSERFGMQRLHALCVEDGVGRLSSRLHPDNRAIWRDTQHVRLAARGELDCLHDATGGQVDLGDRVLVALRGEAEPTVRRKVQVSGEFTGSDFVDDFARAEV